MFLKCGSKLISRFLGELIETSG